MQVRAKASRQLSYCLLMFSSLLAIQCLGQAEPRYVETVQGPMQVDEKQLWLSHEHILVDFIGADRIDPGDWHHDAVIIEMLPYLETIQQLGVDFFVDATPNFLGRDVGLLKKLSDRAGITIITNTGLYGARQNKYVPSDALRAPAQELADRWIAEFKDGIEDSGIRPGFIKIGVDAAAELDSVHRRLVQAAALTHLETGLTIASHTGPAVGLWPQLKLLKEAGVSPGAFIWVHAQQESDKQQYLRAAQEGCWISIDNLGWSIKPAKEKILFCHQNNLLDHVLISHDAGWFDPQKDAQNIKSFDQIFTALFPQLLAGGLTQQDLDLLVRRNPVRALEIRKRLSPQSGED